MDYTCSICGEVVKEDLKAFLEHGEEHIVDEIQKKHPDWAAEDGICHKCLDYYKHQIKGDLE